MTTKKRIQLISLLGALGFSGGLPLFVKKIDKAASPPVNHVGHALLGAVLFGAWYNVYLRYKK